MSNKSDVEVDLSMSIGIRMNLEFPMHHRRDQGELVEVYDLDNMSCSFHSL